MNMQYDNVGKPMEQLFLSKNYDESWGLNHHLQEKQIRYIKSKFTKRIIIF